MDSFLLIIIGFVGDSEYNDEPRSTQRSDDVDAVLPRRVGDATGTERVTQYIPGKTATLNTIYGEQCHTNVNFVTCVLFYDPEDLCIPSNFISSKSQFTAVVP